MAVALHNKISVERLLRTPGDYYERAGGAEGLSRPGGECSGGSALARRRR
jgi:hypothetical protein